MHNKFGLNLSVIKFGFMLGRKEKEIERGMFLRVFVSFWWLFSNP